MSLKTILDQIESQRPAAEMDIGMGNPNTLTGRIGLKKASIESIKRLKVEYRDQLLKQVMFIVVTGPSRDIFSEIASNNTFDSFSANPNEFYEDLVSRIDHRLFGREGVKHLFGIASNILEDKAGELNINEYDPLSFSEKYNSSVKSAQDFVPLIRTAINDQVGSEIAGLNSVYSIVDKAIEKKHAATITSLVLNTADERFAFDLQKNLKRITKNVFLVVAGKLPKAFSGTEGLILVKNVTEDSVGEALTSIRNKI